MNESDLHLAQKELERMNRLYAMLSHINRAIMRAEDPDELYALACRIALEQGGFSLAWVGLVEPGSRRVLPVASAGVAAVELAGIVVSAAGRAEELSPTGYAVCEERPFIVDDLFVDPQQTRWRDIASRWGIRTCGAFPLRLEGVVIGAFTVAAGEVGFFGQAEIHLLKEVADDISFALDVIRREEKRSAAESKMQYLAYYDIQTGLPGRALFEGRLGELCAQSQGHRTLAVLVARLRRYHGVLQTLGQTAGLEIARTVANRLESTLPALFVARITESEFAVMLEDSPEQPLVEETARRMHCVLAGGVDVEGQEVFLDPFVGIALHPRDGSAQELLKHAAVAAATSPHDASSICSFFVPDMEKGSQQRLDLDTALRRALERNEFLLHYQPQVDLVSGRVVGIEALLRWQRHGHGLVLPQDFIPLLEDSGLIWAVGEWALQEACRCNRQWQNEGLPLLRMAVNLSACQFHDGDIFTLVRRALDASKLDPEWLELELTEGIVLLNADAVIRTMHKLNGDGISHALDDFGTGYSSLSYLQRLPVARIKIDKSFITNITSRPTDAAIARAVVGMAHSLGVKVIAEGVETEGQLGYLRGLGCEEMQGYLFSRPLPEDEFAALLRDGRSIALPDAAKPERVLLLVDDEPAILSAVRRALRRDGYRILTAASAREGFDLLASHPVGVVVCDQRMPEITGTEFLRRTKELYPHTVRIILSGFTELNSVIDAVNRGAVYKFLTKPWEDDVLAECLRDAFRLYEMGRDNRDLSRKLKELGAT
ncbi:MAG: EAL domain-containing protein [Sterolibacterium sp.]